MGTPPSGRETSALSASFERGLEIAREIAVDLRIDLGDARFERAQHFDGRDFAGAQLLLQLGDGKSGEVHALLDDFGHDEELVGRARRIGQRLLRA